MEQPLQTGAKRICLVIMLIAWMSIPSLNARKTLYTELNGFKWYLYESEPYYEDGAYSYAGKLLIKLNVNDNVAFFCISEHDPGRFIFEDYMSRGDYKYALYDSTGNFIKTLDIPGHLLMGLDDNNVNHEIKRIKCNNRFYFIVNTYNNNTYYGLIDDNGITTIPFSRDEITNEAYDINVPLSDFLIIGRHGSGFSLIKPSGEYVLRGGSKEFIQGRDRRVLYAYYSEREWLLDNEGQVLIDDAKKIEISGDDYIVTKTSGNVGLYSGEGKCIISPDLGYNSFSLFVGPQKNKYYKVRENTSDNYGIINLSGAEILPCEFENIDFIGGDFFKFKSGSAWGVVSIAGKVIIPTSRGYTSIGKYSTLQKTIPYTMDGYKGECNNMGRQISKIRVGQTTASNNSSNTSKSNTSKSNTSAKTSTSNLKSENNDKYWFLKYGQGNLDGNGNPIESSLNYVYPQKESMFEIQFVYEENASSPVTVYLNEVRDNSYVSSQRLGGISPNSSTVKFKSDKVDIFLPGIHLVVTEDGTVIIYKLNSGKYANGSVRIFQPDELSKTIYSIRYGVLVDKLKKYVNKSSGGATPTFGLG